jgi:hypothetical protein
MPPQRCPAEGVETGDSPSIKDDGFAAAGESGTGSDCLRRLWKGSLGSVFAVSTQTQSMPTF